MAAVASPSPILISSSPRPSPNRKASRSGHVSMLNRESRTAPMPVSAETGFCTASAFARLHGLGHETDQIIEVNKEDEAKHGSTPLSRSPSGITVGERERMKEKGRISASTFIHLSDYAKSPSASPPKFVSHKRLSSNSPLPTSNHMDTQAHAEAKLGQSMSPRWSANTSPTLRVEPEQQRQDLGSEPAAKRARISDQDESIVYTPKQDQWQDQAPNDHSETITGHETATRENHDESEDLLPDISLLADYVPAVMKKKKPAAKKPSRAKTITAKAIELWKIPEKAPDSMELSVLDRLGGTRGKETSTDTTSTLRVTTGVESAISPGGSLQGQSGATAGTSNAQGIAGELASTVAQPPKRARQRAKSEATAAAALDKTHGDDNHETNAGEIETKTKPKKRKSRKKVKVAALPPRLRSPISAQRRIVAQDLVFGTSSQLAEDPEAPSRYWRDLQVAMEESEEMARVNEIVLEKGLHDEEDDDNTMRFASKRVFTTKIARLSASRNLWSAGDRDENGSVMLAEKLPSTPECLHHSTSAFVGVDQSSDTRPDAATADAAAAVPSCPSPSPSSSSTNRSTYTLSISRTSKRPRLLLQQSNIPPCSPLSQISQNTVLATRSLSQTAAASEKPKARRKPKQEPGPSKKKEKAVEESSRAPKRARGRPRKASVSASVDLATHSAMALERPAEEDNKPVEAKKVEGVESKRAESEWTHIDDVQASISREDTKWTHIDEIEDSEAETNVSSSSSSSPSGRGSATKMGSLELTGPSDLATETLPSNEDAQKILFTQITRAVKSAPRSSDPKCPSWHEKILMYDPIVLEDLAAWLNSGALCSNGRSNDEPPLDPAVVQKWCEEKSICCLWREGLRGGVKVRY